MVWSPDRQRQGMRILGMVAVLAAWWASPGAYRALAMIDPSFTPMHLAQESRGILAGKLRQADRPDQWLVADIRVLKGEGAGDCRLVLDLDKRSDANEIRELLRAREATDVVLCRGEYWGTEPGLLLVWDVWLRLEQTEAGEWQIKGYAERMYRTYNGAADKLVEMVQYILHHDEAYVPVSVDIQWRARVSLGRVVGTITGMAPLDAGPGRKASLFVASSGGDRVFALGAKRMNSEDLTADLRLDTASGAFAFVDLDRDGRCDLVSWDGEGLRVRFRKDDGTFVGHAESEGTPLPGGCDGLAVLSPGQNGSPGLLVSAGWPSLLGWNGKGWSVTPLPGDQAHGPSADPGQSCVVADWDGDGYPDVLQLRETGSLLWRGKAGGFQEPVACDVRSGGSPARWCIGDFDADGRLDLFVSGSESCELWESAGSGRFRPVARYAGSLQKKRAPGVADCLATDLNHDGREDLVLFYANGRFLYHFNRGYRLFGEEGELSLAVERPAPEAQGDFGPLRAAAGDFDGDGALDLAAAFTSGEVYCFLSDLPEAHGVWVALPPGRSGPVMVSVWQGEAHPVCVGTYSVGACSPPTYASLRTPEPCKLKWRWPDGPPHVLDASEDSMLVLPRDGAGQVWRPHRRPLSGSPP